jgi:LPXTG-motif cell wall-anchored protein
MHQGAATGGFCALGAGTTSRAALTGFGVALVLAAVVLARRRRRR